MERILHPTDFTAHAERARGYALALAHLFGARVELLTSVYLSPVPVGPYTYAPPTDYLERSREVARKALEQGVAIFGKAGVEAAYRLADTAPSNAICQRAVEWKSDLIAMGTVGHTGLRHLFLGSVAERTARLAPCPVLTAHADSREAGDFRTILVLTDFSASADAALAWARTLAVKAGGKLVLAHSYALPAALWPDAHPVGETVVKSLRGSAEAALAARTEHVEGCPVEPVTTHVPAEQAALALAEERGADLIVLGTHGRTGLAHVALGSTAERVIRLANTPVVTVKSDG